MDLLGLFCVALIALQILPHDRVPLRALTIVLATGAAGIAISLFLIKRYGQILIERSTGAVRKLLQLLYDVAAGFAAMHSVSKVAAIAAISVVVWMNEAVAVFLISRVLELNFTFLQASAVLVGTCLGYMIPAAPGGVGTMDFVGKQTLLLLKFPPELAVSFVLVLHAYQVLVNVLVGAPCLIKVGASATELVAQAQEPV
jgi:uncharacterized membrane protein YbhN (UPF0104 family)